MRYPTTAQLRAVLWDAVDGDLNSRAALAAEFGSADGPAKALVGGDPRAVEAAWRTRERRLSARDAFQRAFSPVDADREPCPGRYALARVIHAGPGWLSTSCPSPGTPRSSGRTSRCTGSRCRASHTMDVSVGSWLTGWRGLFWWRLSTVGSHDGENCLARRGRPTAVGAGHQGCCLKRPCLARTSLALARRDLGEPRPLASTQPDLFHHSGLGLA